MIEQALIVSLKIVFVWGAMQEGMILFPLRRMIDWMIDPLPSDIFLWIRKPLYDCLFCMSSVWGFVFSVQFATLSWAYVSFLFVVGGMNYIIQSLITTDE